MRRSVLALTLGVVLGSAPAFPQSPNWYDLILPEKTHDFGTVARGSKVRHTFRIVNTTNQDVRILNWRTKCGCTDVRVGAKDIPPGTQTTVELTLDTTRFVGPKPSGLVLIFDRPAYREVDLTLTSFIRGDVMLNPGGVDFGVVARGSGRSLTLNLTYHGGQPDWAITRLTTISDHITSELSGPVRLQGGVRIGLRNYRPGPVKIQLWDRLPKPQGEAVAVHLVRTSAELSTDALYQRTARMDNLLRWDLDLPAGTVGDKTLYLNYEFRLEYARDLPQPRFVSGGLREAPIGGGAMGMGGMGGMGGGFRSVKPGGD